MCADVCFLVVGRKYDAIVQSGIPIRKRYDIPGSFSIIAHGIFPSDVR